MKPILSLLAALAVTTSALADQPSSDAYDLKVVLRFGAHNWLGPQFRERVRESLMEMLTDGLGTMGNVNVIDLGKTSPDTWPPLWKDVLAKGLGELDLKQKSEKKEPLLLGNGKSHFVFIDFVDGLYEIQARQHDGQTGIVSPWRRERTADRSFVARIVGKLIGEDFGVVGTLATRGDKNDNVRVVFKGASQGAPLERFAQRGDVFALVQVIPGAKAEGAAPKETAFLVDDTYLQMTEDPKGGECTARVVHRAEKNPMIDAPRGQSFRCIRLGTRQGPMRLRLADLEGRPLRNVALLLWVHSEGFQDGPQHDEETVNADRNGTFLSSRNYDRIAFARIITGGNSIARVPVPIEDLEITARISLNPGQSAKGDLQAMADDLYREYLDVFNTHVQKVRRLTALTNKGRNEEAKTGYENARADVEASLKRLGDKMKEVQAKLAGSGITVAKSQDIDKRLVDLHEKYNEMIGRLGSLLREEKSPTRVEQKVKLEALRVKIVAAINADEYDEAIEYLRQAVAENPDRKDIKQEYEKLLNEWTIKDEEHHKARDFVYKDWAALKTSGEIEAKLPTARKQLAVCISKGDYLTIMKLRNSLGDLLKIFSAEANAGGDKAKLAKIGEDFAKFSEEVDKAIQSRKGK